MLACAAPSRGDWHVRHVPARHVLHVPHHDHVPARHVRHVPASAQNNKAHACNTPITRRKALSLGATNPRRLSAGGHRSGSGTRGMRTLAAI